MARVALKEGLLGTFIRLLGCKPILDGYRIVCDVPMAEGAPGDQTGAFAVTRIGETAFESLFQSFVQAVALAGAEKRGVRQFVSLGISCLSVANTFMGVSHDIDTLPMGRKSEPLLYGFIPDGPRGNLVCVALFGFGGCYFASKLVGIGMLGSASPLGVGTYLGVEAALLLLVRVAIGNWRAWAPPGESTGFSLLWHFAFIYPLFTAVPHRSMPAASSPRPCTPAP